MRFATLASGSKGNAALIEEQGFRVLIDCGLSYRELGRRCAQLGVLPSEIDALLISHFHSDHVRGLESLLNQVSLELFVPPESPQLQAAYEMSPGTQIQIGPLSISPMALPHDDSGTLGFLIEAVGGKLVFATDFGCPTLELRSSLGIADAVVLEANHDLAMLSECAYPEFLKRRISSDDGHLSNCQSAELLSTSLSPRCQHVVLAHLSERANCPGRAKRVLLEALQREVEVASQRAASCWFAIAEAA